MSKKLTRRVFAALSAMVMAVTMMATSASAETWNVFKERRGASSYYVEDTYWGSLQTLTNGQYLQFRASLMNYSNVYTCKMSGNFTW